MVGNRSRLHKGVHRLLVVAQHVVNDTGVEPGRPIVAGEARGCFKTDAGEMKVEIGAIFLAQKIKRARQMRLVEARPRGEIGGGGNNFRLVERRQHLPVPFELGARGAPCKHKTESKRRKARLAASADVHSIIPPGTYSFEHASGPETYAHPLKGMHTSPAQPSYHLAYRREVSYLFSRQSACMYFLPSPAFVNIRKPL